LATIEPGSRIVRIGGQAVMDWGAVMDGLLDAPEGTLAIDLEDPVQSVDVRISADETERLALARSVLVWVEAGVGFAMPGSPAEEGGLEAGDRITSVAGAPVETWWDLVTEIESRPGQRVEIGIQREGRDLIRAVTVGTETEDRGGQSVAVGKIGIQQPNAPMTFSDASIGEAVVHGYRETVAYTGLILGFLRDLVTGGVSPRSVGSIVTIGEQSGLAAQAGFDVFLRFMALFSVNLAVLNLLPIPACRCPR
jgi:regulator of sigma E protease